MGVVAFTPPSLSSLLPLLLLRLLTLLQTSTININMCHCNWTGNIRIWGWGGGWLGRRLGGSKKMCFTCSTALGAPPTYRCIYIMSAALSHLTHSVTQTHKDRTADHRTQKQIYLNTNLPFPPHCCHFFCQQTETSIVESRFLFKDSFPRSSIEHYST